AARVVGATAARVVGATTPRVAGAGAVARARSGAAGLGVVAAADQGEGNWEGDPSEPSGAHTYEECRARATLLGRTESEQEGALAVRSVHECCARSGQLLVAVGSQGRTALPLGRSMPTDIAMVGSGNEPSGCGAR